VRHRCSCCGKACSGYDTRRRSSLHLDQCQFKTIVVADLPRVECGEPGVLQVDVRWPAPDPHFMVLMKRLISDWLLDRTQACDSLNTLREIHPRPNGAHLWSYLASVGTSWRELTE